MLLLVLDAELVSGVSLVPLVGVVLGHVGRERHVAILQLGRLDRVLVAIPNIVATSLVVLLQLQHNNNTQKNRRKCTIA